MPPENIQRSDQGRRVAPYACAFRSPSLERGVRIAASALCPREGQALPCGEDGESSGPPGASAPAGPAAQTGEKTNAQGPELRPSRDVRFRPPLLIAKCLFFR